MDATVYHAEIRRLSMQRDAAEAQLRRVRYGIEQAYREASRRPELDEEEQLLRRVIEGLAAKRAAS
jgi:hypothetical protein